jgi:uncharacterized protein YutE (UPF0331/DUF86 family)
MKEEEFLADRKNPPFAESFLRRALEAIFDIGRHILAKTYGFKDIEYKAIARELGQRGVVSVTLSESLVKMAGYTNRMVHFYREVSPFELYRLVTGDLGDIECFIKEINMFLRHYSEVSIKNNSLGTS